MANQKELNLYTYFHLTEENQQWAEEFRLKTS